MKSIDIEKLSKEYRVYFEKPALIKSILPFLTTQGKIQQFWALRDISLEIEKGECIGVVGPNGSGKSTILSILAGVTEPTRGKVSIDGKVSSLLSLGAGFHCDLTGQENIYLNSAILGLSKAEVDGIYDDIVEYAGLGKFMNAKLATYSSGMNMRLGFSIAIMIPFDILLIDEILAVGDMEFQTKCYKTMKKYYEDEGKTIIFVSHALQTIEELCTKVIWFEHGKIEDFDESDKVLARYRDRYRDKYIHSSSKLSALGRKYLKEDLGTAKIEVDAGKPLRTIPRGLFGSNIDWVSEGFFFWDKSRNRLDEMAMNLLDPYGVTSFRYPGTVQTDYFHWADAVGDVREPQRSGYPGNQKAVALFGPNEFADLCNSMGAEQFISVNVGTGTREEAAGWLEHCRARGDAVPCWEMGHELYYDALHPLGVDFPFTPAEYAEKAAGYVEALRAIDPRVKVGAIGCRDTGVFRRYSSPDWNRIVLEKLGGQIDFFSVHTTGVPVLNVTPDYDTPDGDVTYLALMAAPVYVRDNLDSVKDDLRRWGRDEIDLAVTQYGVLFDFVPATLHGGKHVKGRHETDENWRQNNTLGSALYEAMLLNIFIRDPSITMAHRYSIFHRLYSSLFNVGVAKILVHPQAHMLRVYSRLAGKTLVQSSVRSKTFSSEAVGIIPPQKGVPYLDVIAARDEDNERLALFVVNRNLYCGVPATIDLKGMDPNQVVIKQLCGQSFSDSNDFHLTDSVQLVEHTKTIREITDPETGLIRIDFHKHSLTVLFFTKENWF